MAVCGMVVWRRSGRVLGCWAKFARGVGGCKYCCRKWVVIDVVHVGSSYIQTRLKVHSMRGFFITYLVGMIGTASQRRNRRCTVCKASVQGFSPCAIEDLFFGVSRLLQGSPLKYECRASLLLSRNVAAIVASLGARSMRKWQVGSTTMTSELVCYL